MQIKVISNFVMYQACMRGYYWAIFNFHSREQRKETHRSDHWSYYSSPVERQYEQYQGLGRSKGGQLGLDDMAKNFIKITSILINMNNYHNI